MFIRIPSTSFMRAVICQTKLISNIHNGAVFLEVYDDAKKTQNLSTVTCFWIFKNKNVEILELVKYFFNLAKI